MRRLAMSFALLLALIGAGCGGNSATKPDGGSGTPIPVDEGPTASPELVDACAKHLDLLHRRRVAKELGPKMAALAGPVPSDADFAASRARVKSLGLKGDDAAFAKVEAFARLAQPTLQRAGHSFLGWTPDLEDVGLAKIRTRRPGVWKQLWGKPVEYEVLLLDGFLVPEYRRFFEDATGHKEGARDVPRIRGKLLVIDAAGIVQDVKRAAADKNPAASLLERSSADDLLREVELREAAYLRLQSDAPRASVLDQAVTWLEILEGSPDLALAAGIVSAGDGPDELRRVGATQAIVLKLRAADEKEERSEVLTMPVEQRRKRLKELAPHYLRAELGH